jgi:hypothetical protein
MQHERKNKQFKMKNHKLHGKETGRLFHSFVDMHINPFLTTVFLI